MTLQHNNYLHEAEKRLKLFDIVLFGDEFKKGLKILEKHVGVKNVDHGALIELLNEKKYLKKKLEDNPKLAKELEKYNKYDMELYRYAKKHLKTPIN